MKKNLLKINQEGYLNLAQAADYTRLELTTIIQLVLFGEIPSVKRGYIIAVKKSDLDGYLYRHNTIRTEDIESSIARMGASLCIRA